jgi:DNA-binding response OmpR family regulator
VKVAVLEADAVQYEGSLVTQLQNFGLDVKGFASATALLEATFIAPFGMVVLDIDIPGIDGFALTRQLRENSTVGILILTRRDEPADWTKGLSEGADAWVVKPVEIEVVAATLQSLARRIRLNAAQQIAPPSIAQWRLLPGRWSLCAPDGSSIVLNPPERNLLTRLFESPGEVVARDELMRTLASAMKDVNLHRLEMIIHRLRRKVSEKFGQPLPLLSVHRYGYFILLD